MNDAQEQERVQALEDVADGLDAGRMARSWAVLTLATLVAASIAAMIGNLRSGAPGVFAAAVAWGICWFGASCALVLTRITHRKAPVVGTLASVFFRMGVPLAAGFLLHRYGRWLAKADVLGMILGLYLVTLVVETALAVRLLKPAV